MMIDEKLVVCKKHAVYPWDNKDIAPYPGPVLEELPGMNYREKSLLSPIKLMSKMVRKGSHGIGSRMGYYEVSGKIWIEHNFEFAQMVFWGTLGSFFVDNANRSHSRIFLFCVVRI